MLSTLAAIQAPAINPGGFAVVSELSWLREQIPNAVSEFFLSGYPNMRSVQQNCKAAEKAGHIVLAMYTLPGEAWVESYEIEIFACSEDSYGYVFYVLQLHKYKKGG